MKTLAEHLGITPLVKDDPTPDEFNPEMSDRDFCRGILMSRAYRASLDRRIAIDDLPPAVETMIWDRAFGTRVDKVEIEKKYSTIVESWDSKELAERELMLVRHLRQLKEKSSNDEDTSTRSVH